MADRVLSYELLATDRFSGVFDKAGKAAGGFSKQVDKAAEAELRAKAASNAAERAALSVTAARKRAETVAANATSTEVQRRRALLAVEQAEIRHAVSLTQVDTANKAVAASNKAVGGTSRLAAAGAAGFGVAAAAGAGALFEMVGAAARFDKAMSNVQALTSASAVGLQGLRQAALQAGRDTAFSATEAADGEAELAKAGVGTADIINGALRGALDLASAGQIDVADASNIAATAMTQFGLAGRQVPHIADLLAAAADKAQGGVGDLGVALKYVGPVAHQMGVSIEQTTGVLGELASQGLLAAQAGTGLRGVLSALTSPSKLAAEEMRKLGINVYDAQGNFTGFAGVAGQLHKALSGLTAAQRDQVFGMIFGNEQITTARILYAGGAQAVDEWTKKVNDSGFATKQANAKLNNLAGDLKILKGSLETALIQTGSSANVVLRDAAHMATQAVNAFAAMPKPLQEAAFGLIAFGTAGSGALALFGSVAPKIRAAREELASMGKTGALADSALGLAGRAIGASIPVIAVAVAAWGIFNARQAESKQRVDDFTQAIIADNGALGENSRQTAVNSLEKAGALKAAQDFGLGLKTVTDAVLGDADAQSVVNAVLSTYVAQQGDALKTGGQAFIQHQALGKSYQILSSAVQGQTGEVNEGVASAKRKAEADTGSAAATTGLGAAAKKAGVDIVNQSLATDEAGRSTAGFTGTARDATGALVQYATAADLLKAKLDALNGSSLAAAEADIAFRGSLANLTSVVHDNRAALAKQHGALNLSTAAGRAAEKAFLDGVTAARSYAEAVATQTNSVDQGNAAYRRSVTALLATAAQSGLTKAQVDALRRSFAALPAAKKVPTSAPGAALADRQLQSVLRHAGELPPKKTITVTVNIRGNDVSGYYTPGGGLASLPRAKAEGGWIPGSSPSDTADNIPIRATAGEYMVKRPTARALERKVPGFLDALNSGRLSVGGDPSGAWIGTTPPGFAAGGPIPSVQSWMRGQDPKPYVWGAVGPNAYDCSGFAGSAYGLLTGKGAYRRYFTTSSNFGALGFRRGTGVFTVGVNPATHMAFTVGGLGGEAQSTATGIFVGRGATSPSRFAQQWYLPGVGGLSMRQIHEAVALVRPRIVADILRDLGARTADSGATLHPGLNVLDNRTGKPEPLVPAAGSVRLHPASVQALGEVIGHVVLRGIGANGAATARAANLYARGG